MKLTAACALVSCAALAPLASRAAEGLEFVQAVKDGDGGVAIKNHVGTISIHGGFVYAAVVYTGEIKIFRQDPDIGTLTYSDQCVWGGQHDVVGAMVWIGDRLYFYGGAGHWTGDRDSRGLRWYEADPKTGKLGGGGKLDAPLAAGMVASADGKHLFLLLGQKRTLVTYTLGTDGKPEKTGELVLKEAPGRLGRLTITGDGKTLHCMGEEAERLRVLYRVEVGEGGALKYAGKSSLKEMNAGIKWPEGKWGYGRGSGYSFSPDGRYCYTDFCNYGGADFRMTLFTRDAKTGEITFKEDLTAKTGNTMVQLGCAFEPDGSQGYFISGGESSGNVAGWFKRDAGTGRIEFGGAVKETKGIGPCSICLDAEHGFLYVGGWARPQICVMKTGRKTPAPGKAKQ